MSGDKPTLPQYAFMAWCAVKAQGQLYLYLLWPTSYNQETGRKETVTLQVVIVDKVFQVKVRALIIARYCVAQSV
jgi:hypothetical protein